MAFVTFTHIFGSRVLILIQIGLLASIATAQEENVLKFDIYEQFPAPFFVGDIIQESHLTTKLNASVFNNLRFTILTEGNENARYFDIGSEDGVLRTKEVIDRDTLCPRLLTCVLRLDIAIHSPPDHFEVIKVEVTISDRNDNPPQFLQSHVSKSISESTPAGYSFTISTADDIDSPQYGVKTYVMTTHPSLFELKVTRNGDGSVSNLHIVLKEKLDREEREEYQLTVVAKDGGTPSLSGTLTVQITVLDLNDNFPMFDSDLYVAEVREDTAPGTSIYQVQASDPDAGANGEIVYGFTIKTWHSFGDLFTIKNTTGEISVIGDLDFEQTKTCNLQVTAHDRSAESLLAESRVIINVRDVNDNPPKITVNALTTSGQVEFPESSPVGGFAAYISVNDPDSDENGNYECVLSDPTGVFEAEPQRDGEFKLVSTKMVDHEDKAVYDTEFTCQDNGQPSLSSTKVIKVTITDENDNIPQFNQQYYSVIMKENNAVGQHITQALAIDLDSGKNGEILYSLVGEGARYLHINPISGNITAAVSFDYEDLHNLTVKVTARDQGETPLDTFTFVHLTILDENDNAPLFYPTRYEFEVRENQDIGTDVGQVSATDRDSLGYNDYQFYLQSSTLAMETFTIEPNSGRIFTRKPLDREAVATYNVVVVAADRNKASLVSTATVTIDVRDINDNPPVLRFPSRYNNTVHISNMAPAGYIITQVSADDLDEPNTDNSRLSYSLIRNSGKGVFSIESGTAAVSLVTDLSRSDQQNYELVVLVQDHGLPPLATEAILNVVVNRSLSFPHNVPGGQGPKDPIIGGQNLTIVIAVAVVSTVLILILIIAIVILRRQEQKRWNTNYLNVLFGDQTKLADSPNNGHSLTDSKTRHNMAKSNNVPNNHHVTGSKNIGGYSNKVDINDERNLQIRQVSFYPARIPHC